MHSRRTSVLQVYWRGIYIQRFEWSGVLLFEDSAFILTNILKTKNICFGGLLFPVGVKIRCSRNLRRTVGFSHIDLADDRFAVLYIVCAVEDRPQSTWNVQWVRCEKSSLCFYVAYTPVCSVVELDVLGVIDEVLIGDVYCPLMEGLGFVNDSGVSRTKLCWLVVLGLSVNVSLENMYQVQIHGEGIAIFFVKLECVLGCIWWYMVELSRLISVINHG
ncbi:hypothetical protein Tco_0743841 [Tanacetum coccineum]